MRLIDADATVELLRSLGSRDYRREKGTIADAMKMLSHPTYTPTVDATPVVHGEWLFGELGPVGASVKCSSCGWGIDNVDPILWLDYPAHKFCGNCGTKMDGGV